MQCIFCKAESSGSRSREHIIPESLGNNLHKFKPGVVCDSCNNYFGIKVEKPVLDSTYFRHARFRAALQNKRGRIPTLEVVYGPNGEELGFARGEEGIQAYPLNVRSANSLMAHLRANQYGRFLIPEPAKLPVRDMSRLIAKMSLEIFAFRVFSCPDWEGLVIDGNQLDAIRRYARFDEGATWPFYERRIYPEGKIWSEPGHEPYETLHEFDLLYTPWQELFAVVCILGLEFSMNLGGPEIDGYIRWLDENGYASPLYIGRNIECT